MRRKRIAAALLLIVLLAGAFWPAGKGSVCAADKRTVKVAFFPMDGYHMRGADGSFDGMDAAYLKALCEYVNWEIEYVPCDSWEQALQLLKEKKVDLVGSAQYSAERAKDYQYADLSSGYTFGVIATNGDSTLAYEDFPAMRDIVFGMVHNYVRQEEFREYLADNGIRSPRVIEYESTEKLQQALAEGRIDALVHTFTEIREGQRLVGRFAPRPFYYISYPGNDDVMRELNQGIADLKINQPDLEAALMNVYYYNKFDKTALLTTQEKAYLADKESLIVGYPDGHYPFAYMEDGEFKGLSREMLEASLAMTEQRFEYRRFSDEEEAEKALQEGAVDVLIYCMDSEEALRRQGLAAAREYAEIPLVLVTAESKNAGSVHTLAAVPYLQDEIGDKAMMQDTQVRIYATQRECLEAVVKGQADAALCDGYLAEHLFRTEFQYEDLQIKNIFNGGYPVYAAVREEDKQLADILKKTVYTVNYRTINEYMLKENEYPALDLRKFMRDHSTAINWILLAAVAAVVLVARHFVMDERKIRKLMYKDTILDIWNLNYLIYWGERKLLPENKGNYAVVYLNLSQFRHYNIIYGWGAGEKLLEDMAGFLKGYVDKKSEICARNQGDRFVLLLAFQESEELMERLALLKAELEKLVCASTGNRMAVRMGIYFVTRQEKGLKSAVNYASQAIEFTSDKDGEAIAVYDEKLEQAIKERHEREKLLESVDVEKDFCVYYQPKVDIRSGKIVGAEALIRFLNPREGGAVKSPGFFVPYYEQTGRITEIDHFVFESVCRMLRRRLDAGERVVPVSCNFSRMHFIQAGFAQRVEKVLEKYGIDKELIEVEITETLVMEELQQNMVKQTLDVLHQRGIRLSIDDFGAGYSSLGVFEQIPASVVKLDRSFLLNQRDRDRQVAIMRGIVNLAENLDAQVVCEGVETEDDIEIMKEIGAYVAQGFYYSRPIPENEFEAKLTGEQR